MAETQEWLNPLNKIKFQEAVKKRAKTVVLKYNRHEVAFDLTYLLDGEQVFFKPTYDTTGSFVPRGYFNIRTITDPTWLDH